MISIYDIEKLSILQTSCNEHPSPSKYSPHKGPVLQSFNSSFLWASTSCWTNNGSVRDFRCINVHVLSSPYRCIFAFYIFLSSKLAQVYETIHHERDNDKPISCWTISWLLMAWCCKKPKQQIKILHDLSLRWVSEGYLYILGLCPANERRRYFVTTSLIGWVQA